MLTSSSKKRQLDDEELDSGDDMDRNDRERAASGTPAPEQQKEELVQYSEFGRQPVPEPSDGEACRLTRCDRAMLTFGRCTFSKSQSSSH